MANTDINYNFWAFLDLDDTLWNFAENSLDALISLYKSQYFLKDIFPSQQCFIDTYHKHNAQLWREYHLGNISADFLKQQRFLRTLRDTSFNGDALSEASRLNDIYLSTLVCGRKLIDGAENSLRKISEKCLVGIISNGFLNTQYHKIFNTPLHYYIQRLIISEEIGINKPDRLIFDYALRETGADPHRAVMVGDNPETDILGALNAGWKAIYYNANRKPLPEYLSGKESLFVAETLEEVADIIVNL